MCEYCGCQDIPAIAELTAEHDRLRDLGRSLVDAAGRDDPVAARAVAGAMLGVLGPHSRVEEQGLFPAMAADFGAQLAHLADEHVIVHSTLTALADGSAGIDWQTRARTVVGVLFEHILKEQDGVFPAALSLLTTAEWETVTAVRG